MNYTGGMVKTNMLGETRKHRRPAQEIQDNIFRRMSADRKVELGAELWKLAKDLVGDKINYGKNRPAPSPDTRYRHS